MLMKRFFPLFSFAWTQNAKAFRPFHTKRLFSAKAWNLLVSYPRFWSGEPSRVSNPEGWPWAQNLLKIGCFFLFAWKLHNFEKKKFLWARGPWGLALLDPLVRIGGLLSNWRSEHYWTTAVDNLACPNACVIYVCSCNVSHKAKLHGQAIHCKINTCSISQSCICTLADTVLCTGPVFCP